MSAKCLRKVLRPVVTAAGIYSLIRARKVQKNLTCKMEQILFEDPLTGGANERKFMCQAQGILRSADKKNYAVIAFHVKGFRIINEMFGYENGTKVLRGIHWVFEKNTEAEELSAHVHADRFLLLLSFQSRTDLLDRIQKICADLENTVEFYGIHYKMVPAFGVCECFSNSDADDIHTLICRAVFALKDGVKMENLPVSFYEEQSKIREMTLKNMEDRLESAMKNGEFVVYYQPKYLVSDETLCGAEALVRWKTEDNTLVSPGEFIPVFERDGKIAQLDRYIFRQVCKDIRKWTEEGRNVVPISVNLSRVNLLHPSIAEEYRKEASRYGVSVHLLELEVTESAFAQNEPVLKETLQKLVSTGFSLSIDDFGSEYSSLKTLYDIPAHSLKLDREFLTGFHFGKRGRAIISAVIDLAAKLHMTVIAEGVETREHLDFLKKIHCTAAQGYYFSPPMPERQFANVLPAEKKDDSH
ncbi:MAG: putative signaling protein [Oscillospiraceae bacterium]|jgi:EAL domain-containing protein (putative c-di-GMP-specific phosphodiesterase class I)/GGDEF domain-containing protein